MRDFNSRPDVRLEAFQFAGPTNGGSLVRSRPQSPFSDATGTQVPGERSCSVCEQPPGSCQRRKIGRSGRWLRGGSSIIVNC